jgi:peroxiredoxin Q/BCP
MGMVAKRLQNALWLGVLLAGMLGGAPMATALEVGEQAPDFTLPSTTGEQMSLSQFRGKTAVLIEFYVADFVPT